MSDQFEGSGACVCGASQITAKSLSMSAVACHCSTCRTWGGGPLLSTAGGTEVTIEGGKVTIYDSSKWAERGFCSVCGTHLFYRLKGNGLHFLPVGLFADDLPFVFDRQVFIDEKPGFYCFANETRELTGAEVFALFGS